MLPLFVPCAEIVTCLHPLCARARYWFDVFDRSQLTVSVVSWLQGAALVDNQAEIFEKKFKEILKD